MSEINDEYGVAIRVAQAFERAGIEYALGGSLASSLQGEPRSTNDIDFAARLREKNVDPFVAALGTDFAIDEESLREAIRRRRSCNIFFLPLVVKIDLFVRGGSPFDESELSRRVRMNIGDSALYVASPEDNLLRKLRWFRDGGEVSDRQWRDILGIVRALGTNLDLKYLGLNDLLTRALASQAPP